MMFAPAAPFHPAGIVISPMSYESLQTALRGNATSAAAAVAYPAANLALYIPFVLSAPINIQSVFWVNGTVTGGNCDVGIYNDDGTKVVTLGSTARGSVSTVITSTGLTDTVVGAGRYYMAFLCDSTANIFAWAPGSGGVCEAYGILEQAVGAANLPSPATFTLTTRNYIPVFGIYAQTITL